MNDEKKSYLSLYLLQHAKLERLREVALADPARESEIQAQIRAAEQLRRDIEQKIERVDGGLLSELLYLKYVRGKTLLQIAEALNYSVRHIERLHKKALEKLRL